MNEETDIEIFERIEALRTAQWNLSDALNYKTLKGAEVEFQLSYEGRVIDMVGLLGFCETPNNPSDPDLPVRSIPTIQAVYRPEGSSQETRLRWEIAREEVERLVPQGLQSSGVRRFRLTQTEPWTCEGLPHSYT